MHAFRAGIKKELFAGSGAIGLNCTDLFHTEVSRGSIAHVMGSTAIYRNGTDSRTVLLTFSYRISRNAKDNKGPRDGNGAMEEQNRVKSNGE